MLIDVKTTQGEVVFVNSDKILTISVRNRTTPDIYYLHVEKGPVLKIYKEELPYILEKVNGTTTQQ